MVDISLSIVGGNGDVIALDGSDTNYILSSGFTGTGLPPTNVRITPSAGDGGTWRSTRRDVRTLDLPIYVIGTYRDDVETKLRRLASALSDRVGTPKLVATYSDGSAYETEIHYTGGSETTYGDEAHLNYCRWVVSVQCPDPYWTSVTATSFSVASSSSTNNLLPELDRLLVIPAQVVGNTTVDNIGEVDAFVTWKLENAFTSVTILQNGQGFTYTETVADGSVITIDTKLATVTNLAGVNKYGNLSAAPKLFTIPPDTSVISITAVGTSVNTKISGFYKPRREVIF